jgi:CubicO group peptidase (beta-lactamase class C family)
MFIHSCYLSRTLIFILLFAPSLYSQTKPSNSTPDFSEVRKLIQTEMAARKIPSISVAVARRGEIIWEEAFGFADKENGIRANKETMYYTASVTKTFTATALAVLAERKQIDLDRPINDYLRPMRVHSPLWNSKEATVRMLAQHMSGLTTFARNCWADQPDCRISADETIKRYGILFWRPGDHFDYSNLGYGILGQAIQHASGKSYADYMRDEIFRPLGMTRASVDVGPGFEKYAAVHYSSAFGRRPTAYSASPAASSIYCSAHDLALFGMFHLRSGNHPSVNERLLSDKSVLMMQNSTVSTGGRSRYGMGWWVHEDLNGYRGVLGQGGTDDGMAFLRLIPSEEIVVVMLTNSGDEFPPKVVDEILATLLPSYALKRATAAATTPQQPPPAAPSSTLTGEWTGFVRTHLGSVPLTLSISALGDVQAKLGSNQGGFVQGAPVRRFAFTDRGLTGRLTGDFSLGTNDDAATRPYDLDVELYINDAGTHGGGKGQMLYGAVTIRPRPEAHHGALLSYWVELRKTP